MKAMPEPVGTKCHNFSWITRHVDATYSLSQQPSCYLGIPRQRWKPRAPFSLRLQNPQCSLFSEGFYSVWYLASSTVSLLPHSLSRRQNWFSCLLLAHYSNVINSLRFLSEGVSMCLTLVRHPPPNRLWQTHNTVLFFLFPHGARVTSIPTQISTSLVTLFHKNHKCVASTHESVDTLCSKNKFSVTILRFFVFKNGHLQQHSPFLENQLPFWVLFTPKK